MTEPLLRGVRVVEIAHPLTEHAGRILAGLGAEVLLIEPIGGSMTRHRRPHVPHAQETTRASIPFLARNANKGSIELDPSDADDARTFAGLIARCEVVIDTDASPFHQLVKAASGDAGRITISDENNLGISSIVPFAASGAMACSGWPGKAPCDAPSWLAHDAASIHAALMAVIALLHRDRSGVRLDYEIPLHEAAIASIAPWTRHLHASGLNVAGQGINPGRMGSGPYPVFEAKDGYVKVVIATPRQWGAFMTLIGSPEELLDGAWAERSFREANLDAFYLICGGYLVDRTVNDLFHTGQEIGLTITPVLNLRGFRSDPHAEARQLFVDVGDPEFGSVEMMRAPVVTEPAQLIVGPTPAPALAADNARLAQILSEPERTLNKALAPEQADVDPAQPLAGIRLLQLGSGAVVPEACAVAALLGADVIRVESRANPDFLRRAGREGDLDDAPTYNQLNLGVRSITVDMREPDGRELVARLVTQSDAVVENMRGPVVPRWGFDYAGSKQIRADIICLSSQGMGAGPYGDFQSFGPNLSAFCGAVSQWAHRDDPYPVGATVPHPDHVAGKQAFIALIAAIRRRDHGEGGGCFVEAAQVEAPAHLIADRFLAQAFVDGDLVTDGNYSPDMAPHGCYECADDQWIALAIEDDGQWASLVSLVDESWASDPRFARADARLAASDELDKALSGWVAGRDVADVEGALRSGGVPASRVVDGNHLATAAGNEPGGIFAPVDHPVAGTAPMTGVPVKTSTGRRPQVQRSPLLGEHTGEVLAELLGVGADDIISLTERSIVGY